MRRILFFFVVGLAGCYASEKAGKDIQDTSHDVNQGGIHFDNGALGVRRPLPTTITSAPMTKATGGTSITSTGTPAAPPAPPAPAAPAAPAAPGSADAGVAGEASVLSM